MAPRRPHAAAEKRAWLATVPDKKLQDMQVWRTAKVLIKTYGQQASQEAMQRAQDAQAEGKPGIADVWQRVLNAIRELQRNAQKPG